MNLRYVEEIISWGIQTNSHSNDLMKHYFTFITGDAEIRATVALSYFSPGFSPDTGVGAVGSCFKNYETVDPNTGNITLTEITIGMAQNNIYINNCHSLTMVLNTRRAEAYAVATAFIFKTTDVATPAPANIRQAHLKSLYSLVLFNKKNGGIVGIHQFQMLPGVNKKLADAVVARAKKGMLADAAAIDSLHIVSLKLSKTFMAGEHFMDVKSGRMKRLKRSDNK